MFCLVPLLHISAGRRLEKCPKSVFIILELVVYGIHISGCAFYPVKHKVTVPHEMDDVVSVLFQLGMGTQFQVAGVLVESHTYLSYLFVNS